AGRRVPSEASEESFSCGVPPVSRFAPSLFLATASVMPIAAAITTTAALIPATPLRRRLRRASRARILVIFSRACCLFLLPLDTACTSQSNRSTSGPLGRRCGGEDDVALDVGRRRPVRDGPDWAG